MSPSAPCQGSVGPRCPLCGSGWAGPSWLGSSRFRGKSFEYVACGECRSLYCERMPDADDRRAMYGARYEIESGASRIDRTEESSWVMGWLERLPAGAFTDYGCGDGHLLSLAARRGWDVLGVELTAEVAQRTALERGLPVLEAGEALAERRLADVLHLGDVLEHLTDLDREFPRILSLLKPGGLLLAQGPLEANGNLFTWMLRLSRFVLKRPPREMPPYHVILATARGQRALFERFELKPIEWRLLEVDWPAPQRLSAGEGHRARTAGLYLLRRVSRLVSSLNPRAWGNRYRYAGRSCASFP